MHRYEVSFDDEPDRVQCAGVHQLRALLASGRIHRHQWVLDVRTGNWLMVYVIIEQSKRRSDLDIIDECAQTLDGLNSVAKEIERKLKNDRNRRQQRNSIRTADGISGKSG